ncbi:MAG: sigma-70 family RNA polymerase sigma factor [Myxococcaceae bacterium]|nr:sigma-70 family RNA polymerase sigma factor [Myxococcaceae bacterium]
MPSRPRASEATFERLYDAHRREVFRWALRFGGGRATWAEDVTHDAFMKLWQHLSRVDTETDVGGWLYRVTANLALSRLRRDRSFTSLVTRFFTDEEEAAESADVEVTLKEEARAALEALRALPPREAMVLTMKVMDGKSQREIAEALSMSEGYVSKLAARGWDRLRAAGWEVPDAA